MLKYRCTLCGWSGDNPTILNKEEVIYGPEEEKFDDILLICPNGCKDEDGQPKIVNSWGGPGRGQGRKPTGRRKRNIYVTDEEFSWIKEQLEIRRASHN